MLLRLYVHVYKDYLYIHYTTAHSFYGILDMGRVEKGGTSSVCHSFDDVYDIYTQKIECHLLGLLHYIPVQHNNTLGFIYIYVQLYT